MGKSLGDHTGARASRPHLSKKKERVFFQYILDNESCLDEKSERSFRSIYTREISMSSDSKNIRSAILDAALDLFSEHGFHSSPISRIASLAGVGVGSIYRYFSDKDALIHAVFEKVDTPLRCAMNKNMTMTLPTHQQFTHFVTDLIYYLRSHPKEFRFIEQYYNSPYGINKVHAQILQEDGNPSDLFMRLFLNGQKELTIRSLPLPVYLTMTFGPISYLVRYALSGHITVDDDIVEATAEACWNAIKA